MFETLLRIVDHQKFWQLHFYLGYLNIIVLYEKQIAHHFLQSQFFLSFIFILQAILDF